MPRLPENGRFYSQIITKPHTFTKRQATVTWHNPGFRINPRRQEFNHLLYIGRRQKNLRRGPNEIYTDYRRCARPPALCVIFESKTKMITYLQRVAQISFFLSTLVIVLCSCSSSSKKAGTTENITAVKKYHQIWSNGNVEELNKIIAPDFTSHFIGGFEYKGIDGAKNSILETRKAFPDWKEDVVDIIAQDDKVVTRYHSTGTQLGNWDGIDSTGNKVDIYEASIYRLEGGKIVEQWGFWDEIKLKKQMTAKSTQSK